MIVGTDLVEDTDTDERLGQRHKSVACILHILSTPSCETLNAHQDNGKWACYAFSKPLV